MKTLGQITSILLLFCLPAGIFAQSTFQKSVGGNSQDEPYTVSQTTDGGFLFAGATHSFGLPSFDIYVFKLNIEGDLLWSQTFGGSSDERALGLSLSNDSSFAVTGYTESFGHGNKDVIFVKNDRFSRIGRVFGGTGEDIGYSIRTTSDGGFIIAGTSKSFDQAGDMYLIRLNNLGNVIWEETVGGVSVDNAYSVKQTSDGGFIVVGSSVSFGTENLDVYLVKLDPAGIVEWGREFGSGLVEEGSDVWQNNDGSYIITGYVLTPNNETELLLLKVSSSGNMIWAKRYEYGYMSGFSVLQNSDGHYIITGSANGGFSEFLDQFLMKTDASGGVLWRWYYGATSNVTEGRWVQQTSEGGYILAGKRGGHACVIKTNSSGNSFCQEITRPIRMSNFSLGQYSGAQLTRVTTAQTITSINFNEPVSSNLFYCYIGIQPISENIPQNYELLQNYPNPFNPSTKIKFALPKSSFAKLVVYDALGREVETLVNEQLNAGIYEAEWNAAKFSSGVYLYKLETEGIVDIKKMVLVK